MSAPPAAPPVEAQGLTRDYGPVRAVEDVSFRVERGEIVGLLGPNGAGKTTTLRMLTGNLFPSEGQVRLSGFDVFREGRSARAHLGYLPEQLPLYGEMPVHRYLAFVASMKGVAGPAAVNTLAGVRSRLRLEEVWERPSGALSRGYRQRVGLAQALLGNPDLLILDEPTAGLDPNQIRDFRTLVRELGREHSILLSTHILPEALEVCDRVIILNRGKVVAMDRPDRLGERPEGRILIGRVRAGTPPAEEIAGLAVRWQREGAELYRLETRAGDAQAHAVLRALIDSGVQILEWRSGAAGLEEVFRRLTLGESVE
jgi:ABC-2 type transport system ATP-binding protein